MDLIAERNFSELLRESGDVLEQAEHQDILLRRRDGADMMLVDAEREKGIRDVLAMSVHILSAIVAEIETRKDLGRHLGDIAPWTIFLPRPERKQFLRDFIRTARACNDLGTYEPLVQTLREWKATAAVHADPALLTALRAPASTERKPVPKP